MYKVLALVALLLVPCVVTSQGTCQDIPPDTTFPCEFFKITGQCDKDNAKLKFNGKLAYCLVTCDLCHLLTAADDLSNVQSQDALEVVASQGGNFAVAEGIVNSLNQFAKDIQDEITSAVVVLTDEDFANQDEKEDKVTDGAISTTETIATAIATAMSSVSLRGVTSSLNSKASGTAVARAEAVANATASAYAVAVAQAGDEFTELEASTLETDVQTALTSTMIDFAISGETSVSVQQEAFATAVAEALATATAQVFASLTDTDSQAIAFAVAQAFNSSELTCLSFCYNEPPTADKTCEEYVESNTCSDIVGYCECACGTCQIGSEATVTTFTQIISESDAEQVVGALGEAFAQGAKGADAVAQAFVQTIAQGNAQAVTSAIAEAFGAQEITASAMVEAISQAINIGGEEVTIAVADAFALSESGGYTEALAEAIADAWSTSDGDDSKATAMTNAISTAIANGDCQAISLALSEAYAIASGEGTGDSFAATIADTEAINDCFYGSETASTQSVGEGYVYASSEGATEEVEKDIEDYLMEDDVPAAVAAVAKAILEGRTAAVSDAFAHAVGNGVNVTIIVEAATLVVIEHGKPAIAALAEAFAAVEVGFSEELADVFVEGILAGGDKAQSIASVIAEAVGKYECSVFAQSLPLAQSDAENYGMLDAFVAALPEVVKGCLRLDFGLAHSVKDALLNGDLDAVQEMIVQATGEADTAAIVEGLSVAIAEGADCPTVSHVLSLASGLTNLSSEVYNYPSVVSCLGTGYSECRGLLSSQCCSSGYPEQCGCTRFRCRANKNADVSLPELGLHIYTDVGNRNCMCPMPAF
eukprot:TRINITY_DN315_c0_g1_i3.p1 TRINITY_DN315_c0_g1~~TRINITY_DN315_c0_g1_i3.p1  ORF type:complete len:824 (+),score=157.67 TRINITY_DN315_c0_g1_i3:258-2729(+)